MKDPTSWRSIESQLHHNSDVEGGFSNAAKCIVHLADGKTVFVKQGVDTSTRAWIKKELVIYRSLEVHAYPHIPELVACNEEETAFALDALHPQHGWDWSKQWTVHRMEKTLEAMETLAGISLLRSDIRYLDRQTDHLYQEGDGWKILGDASDLQQALRHKLDTAGRKDLADGINFDDLADRMTQFGFRTDTFIHSDVRGDNCAWNVGRNIVKLVDWTWARLGDPRIDQAALMVHASKYGLDVVTHYADRLDPLALQWLGGFACKAAVTPIWPGGPAHLRDLQLQSGIMALDLANRL